MRFFILPAIGAVLLAGLSACGGDDPAAPKAKVKSVKVRNVADEQMQAATEVNRRIGLIRAIRGSGNRCPRRVESDKRQGEHEGMAVWTARCDDNRQWAIFIGANGQAQVRNCEQVVRLGLPACAELPPAPPQFRMENGKAVPIPARQ
jgi:hypothetical protein